MGELNLILGWGSPLGIGGFLALLGLFIYLLAHSDTKKKDK